jgi:hypothetical protein
MSNTGISNKDFTQILSDFSRIVSYKVNSKSVDSMGNETDSFATATDYSVVFFKEDCRYLFDKEGLIQVGDAYIMAPTTLGIKRYDQFSIDGNTYYIQNVIRRYVLSTAMFDYANCFLVTTTGTGGS